MLRRLERETEGEEERERLIPPLLEADAHALLNELREWVRVTLGVLD